MSGVPPPLVAAQLDNPNISGFRWREFHSAVQPVSATAYDWSAVDAALVACVTAGKLFGLSVSWGNTTSRWVYDDAGVEEFIFDPVNEVGSMPNPFDPLYLPIIVNFITAMGAIYDPHPNVSYVIISGFMQHFEGYLAKTADEETRLNAAAVAAGFTDIVDGWTQIGHAIVSAFVTAFPNTACIYTSAKPFPSDASGTQQSIFRDWIPTTYPMHGGWMTAQLHAAPGPWPMPTAVDYPFGFQAISAGNDLAHMYNTVPVPDPVPPQIMIDFINNGYSKKAQFLEIYPFDMNLAANQGTFNELAPLFHSFVDYVPPGGGEPPPPPPPPPVEPPMVITRLPVTRIIPCSVGTHARNIILGRKRKGPPVVAPVPPGPVEILNVQTPHEPSSGTATATWLSPEGSDGAHISYRAFITGGPGTVTIVDQQPA
jgi:hypothetical protein